jgi:carotenoid 1,2-hydratase
VFSPYYAAARRRGHADPLAHCAFNLALYGPRAARWCMTERGQAHVERTPRLLRIGPSRMEWQADTLTVHIDEVAMPWPRRMRGRIRLHPQTRYGQPHFLDAAGRHAWTPVVPSARVEVEFEQPRLRWRGHGYFDMNAGEEPLEAGFRGWHWSRAALRDGATALLYDATTRAGTARQLGLRIDRDGRTEPFTTVAAAALGRSGWGIARHTRADAADAPGVIRTLEDTPFYARSLLATRLLGEQVTAVHESLDLDRFAQRWVQLLLPFRMPRRGR